MCAALLIYIFSFFFFFFFVERLGENYISISRIIPTIKATKNKLASKIRPALVTEAGNGILDQVETYIKEKLSIYEERSITRIATFMDSRFRRQGFQNETSFKKAKEDVEKLVLEQIQKSSRIDEPQQSNRHQESIFDYLGEPKTTKDSCVNGIVVIENYLKSPKLDIMATDEELLQNLKNQQHPATFYIAKRFLCTPGQKLSPNVTIFFGQGGVLGSKRSISGSAIVFESHEDFKEALCET